MNLLLDTHVWLWSLLDPGLSSQQSGVGSQQSAVSSQENGILSVSVAMPFELQRVVRVGDRARSGPTHVQMRGGATENHDDGNAFSESGR